MVAPLSTLPHWERELSTWTDMYWVNLHGPADSRRVVEKYEWLPQPYPKTNPNPNPNLNPDPNQACGASCAYHAYVEPRVKVNLKGVGIKGVGSYPLTRVEAAAMRS